MVFAHLTVTSLWVLHYVHFFMTQLAANFAAKGLLNLMASSFVAIDLAHSVHMNAQMNIYLPELRVLQELVCGFRSV